jgi:hypothetical protein
MDSSETYPLVAARGEDLSRHQKIEAPPEI